jgi:hypothetical protein
MKLWIVPREEAEPTGFDVDYWEVKEGTLLLYQDTVSPTMMSRDVFMAVAAGEWRSASIEKFEKEE